MPLRRRFADRKVLVSVKNCRLAVNSLQFIAFRGDIFFIYVVLGRFLPISKEFSITLFTNRTYNVHILEMDKALLSPFHYVLEGIKWKKSKKMQSSKDWI